MSEQCPDSGVGEVCVVSSGCDHDVIVNGVCHFCGERDVYLNHKPATTLIPADALIRSQRRGLRTPRR